jgi:periplasmic protein TonB
MQFAVIIVSTMKSIFLSFCCLLSFYGFAQKSENVKNDSIQAPNSVYIKVDRSPEFPGGNDKLVNYIHNNAHLPSISNLDSLVTGKVLVEFIVEKDGTLSNIKILKGVGERYDQECSRLFGRMPKWTPGKIGNHNVRTLMMIPITIS